MNINGLMTNCNNGLALRVRFVMFVDDQNASKMQQSNPLLNRFI